MPGDYTILASIHDELQMGDYARHIIPQWLNLAQQNNWSGRQLLDLGCGTASGFSYLSKHGYIVTGLDRSPEMLALAQQNLKQMAVNATLLEKDLGDLAGMETYELAFAVDVLCELRSLRELETAFRQIHTVLRPNKVFIFDMYTIEGLVKRAQAGDRLEYDNNGLTIFVHNDFDYERQEQERRYTIFRQKGNQWQRQDASRIVRAYPIQALITLLGRCGFEILQSYNADLKPYTQDERTSRVTILAQKR